MNLRIIKKTQDDAHQRTSPASSLQITISSDVQRHTEPRGETACNERHKRL